MGYVAVKGGTLAIEESIKRLKLERVKQGRTIEVENQGTQPQGPRAQRREHPHLRNTYHWPRPAIDRADR